MSHEKNINSNSHLYLSLELCCVISSTRL